MTAVHNMVSFNRKVLSICATMVLSIYFFHPLSNSIIRPDSFFCFAAIAAQNKGCPICHSLVLTKEELMQKFASIAVIFKYRTIFNTITAIIKVWYLQIQFSGAYSAYKTNLYLKFLRFIHNLYLCPFPFVGQRLSYFSPTASAMALRMRLDGLFWCITSDTHVRLTPVLLAISVTVISFSTIRDLIFRFIFI